MKDKNINSLSLLIDMKNTKSVLSYVRKLFLYQYTKKDFKTIQRCYNKIQALFEGNYKGYNACNTKYHNFYHTIDVLLAVARLLDGYNSNEKKMSLPLALNLYKASLFHDTGYIQEKWDNAGTGAKYSLNHVGRSIAFIVKNRSRLSISKEDVDVISKMIRCTEIKTRLSTIPFSSEEEKIAGMILGSADILGQMSDREYLERLIFLYNEMKEAGVPDYSTEFDIIKGTLKFYESIKKRINNSFKKVYNYAYLHFNKRFNITENLYIKALENNIAYLKKIVSDNSTNFRNKLKRGNILKNEDLLSETQRVYQ